MTTTPEAPVTVDPATLTGERRDLVETLRKHRGFLLQTLDGLDEDRATRRTTASILNLAGLVKHVADVEAAWLRFATGAGHPMGEMSFDVDPDDPVIQERLAAGDLRHDEFHLIGDETLESVVAYYAEVAARTDAFLAGADLDAAYPLPDVPWFEPGTSWSVRRVMLHLLAETAQHAGHADMLREHLDGARTMG